MSHVEVTDLVESDLNKLCAYIAGMSIGTFCPSSHDERGLRDFSVLLDKMLNQIPFSGVFDEDPQQDYRDHLQRKVCHAVVSLKYPEGVPKDVLIMLNSFMSRERLVDALIRERIDVMPQSRQVMRL